MNMSPDQYLYQQMARHYQELFPSSDKKRRWAEELVAAVGASRILDLGCASGEFLAQLQAPGRELVGIDVDEQMIHLAQSQWASRAHGPLKFVQASMLDYLSQAQSHSYDLVFCLGNTLAYLQGYEQLSLFFGHAHRVLSPGGALAIQLLNFENPQLVPGFVFPVLETQYVRLYRSYGVSTEPEQLLFQLELEDKVHGKSYRENHNLWALGTKTLTKAAVEQGFTSSKVSGGYGDQNAEPNDFFRLAQFRP